MPELRIFLSHAHQDNAFCQRLYDTFTTALPTAHIYFDKEALIPGDVWIETIQHELVNRPIFIVILSRAAVVSEWVRAEANLALRKWVEDRQHRRIIPVLHQQCDADMLAPLLGNFQFVDCASQAEALGLQSLIAALQSSATGSLHTMNPELERARALASQVHSAFVAEQWRETARLGRLAMTLPGNDRDAELWSEVGRALLRIDQPQEGLTALDQALRLNTFRNDLWREKARTLAYRLGQPDEAIVAWDKALAATAIPHNRFDIFAEECEALNVTGRPVEALAANNEALRIDDGSARIWLSRGNALWALSRFAEANQAFDRALASEPQNPAVWKGKCFVLVKLGMFADAVALCDKVLALTSTDAAVWANKGKALFQLGRYDEAHAALDQALRLDPTNVHFWNDKAQGYIALKQFGHALPVIDRAITISPTSGYLWRQKATIFQALGRREEAWAAEVHAQTLGS